MNLRRIRSCEGRALRAIRLCALAESPDAFGSTLERELGFDDALWESRATEASTGTLAATFVVEGDDADAPWLGIVSVLGPEHDPHREASSAELVSMWVAPEARRLGLADRLVDAAVGFARSIGVHTLALAVTRNNQAARALYERHGFVESCDVAYESGHPCHGEVAMVLRL